MSISLDYNALLKNGINSNYNGSYVINDNNTSQSVKGSGLVDTSGVRTPSSELGKDAFMQILIAQLQNQDPMEPASDTEFIAQMAQFSALEQMQLLNQTFQNSQVYNYVGKTVVADATFQGEDGQFTQTTLTGVVSGVQMVDNTPYLIVGDYLLKPSAITQVYNSSDLDSSILQGGSLIGKHVEANMVGSDGNISKVTGQVTKVKVIDGRVYAVIDDKHEIPVANITTIDDGQISEAE